jgi:hypothetical protein
VVVVMAQSQEIQRLLDQEPILYSHQLLLPAEVEEVTLNSLLMTVLLEDLVVVVLVITLVQILGEQETPHQHLHHKEILEEVLPGVQVHMEVVQVVEELHLLVLMEILVVLDLLVEQVGPDHLFLLQEHLLITPVEVVVVDGEAVVEQEDLAAVEMEDLLVQALDFLDLFLQVEVAVELQEIRLHHQETVVAVVPVSS